jgi:hypothetical protein
MAWAARPVLTAGSRITDDKLDAMNDRIELLSSEPVAVKTADTSVTSNTTVADDPHLQLSLLANTRYDLLAWIAAEGNTAGDLKWQMAWTPSSVGTELNIGGAGALSSLAGVDGDGTWLARMDTTSSPTPTFVLGTNTSNWTNYLIQGNIIVGSTAITLKIQWAQNASSGTATILKGGSWFRAFPYYT